MREQNGSSPCYRGPIIIDVTVPVRTLEEPGLAAMFERPLDGSAAVFDTNAIVRELRALPVIVPDENEGKTRRLSLTAVLTGFAVMPLSLATFLIL